MATTYTSTGRRRSRGLIFGVCARLANSLNLSVTGVRILVLITFLLTGFFPIGVVYIIAALLMKREPVGYVEHGVPYIETYAPRGTHTRLRTTYDSLDKRVQRMESLVTDRGFDWDRRMNNG